MKIMTPFYNYSKDLTNKLLEKVKLDLGFDLPLEKICLTNFITNLDDPGHDSNFIIQDNRTLIKDMAFVIMFPDIRGDFNHYYNLTYMFSIEYDFLFMRDLAENQNLIFGQSIGEKNWRFVDLKLAYGKDKLTGRAKFLELSQFSIYNKLPYTKGFISYRIEFTSSLNVERWQEKLNVVDYSKYSNLKLYLVYEKVIDTSLIFRDLPKLVLNYKNSYNEYIGLLEKAKVGLEIDKTKYFTADVEIEQNKVLQDLAIFNFQFLSEMPVFIVLINKFVRHFVLKDVTLIRYVIVPSHLHFTEDEIRAGL